jgi:UDP-glucose 4-epimerase
MEFADSHVLITGGAGLVGSHLAAAILEVGGTVRVADDLSKGDRSRVPEAATFVEADVSDPDAVAEVVTADLDAVCHLAAYTDTNYEDDRELFETNTAMTHLLLEQMREVGVDQFMFTSSSTV